MEHNSHRYNQQKRDKFKRWVDENVEMKSLPKPKTNVFAKLLRVIDQDFVNNDQIKLYVNGTCHGQAVFSQWLSWIVHPERIVKSIQKRCWEI